MDYEEILEAAYEYAQSRGCNNFKCAAFANSVAYLCTGWSGGYGGVSLREHLVSWSLGLDMGNISPRITTLFPDNSRPQAGNWEYETALAYCAEIVFPDFKDLSQTLQNNLRQIHEMEYHFDNDPSDLEQL